MKIKLSIIINLVCFFAIKCVFGQQKSDISGTVKNLENQSFIAGATIKLNNSYSSKTDSLGFYRFTDIPAGTYNAVASAIGYQSVEKFNVTVSSGNENEMNFELNNVTTQTTQLNEVSVVGNIRSAQAKSIVTPLSIQKLTAEEIKANPGGNFDISRVVNTLPGISGSSDIVGGYRNDIIIRGGGPGENVYYLDGIEIPVINHFATQGSGGGPTGILNVSFIDEVKLSSSAFDSKFDNVLSGVLEFKQRNGNINKTQSNFRLSGTELAGTLEGPLGKSKKVSYMASVRRSYLQALFSLIDLPIRPNYWDFQYKINYQLSKKTTVNFLGVGAIDQFGFGNIKEPTQEKIYTLYQVPSNKQQSYTIGTSLKHLVNDGFWLATLSRNVLNNKLSKYYNNDDSDSDNLRFSNQGSEIENKARLELVKNKSTWRWNFGSMLQYVQYDIDNNIAIPNSAQRLINNSAITFWKYGLFAQISKKLLNEKLSLTLGLRSDGNSFTNENTFSDGLSPKFAFSYDISNQWSMSGSIGRYAKLPNYTLLGYRDANNQYVNKESNYIHSTHYVFGTAFSPRNSTRFTLETFYKKYNNLPTSSSTGINFNPLGVIICSKINGLDIGQDTEFQYLEVAKQTNIYVKYSKKLF